ncbi:MAG: DUF5107 domain-containing protein [Tissierellia bacterium]|nr:DUF5107 domain-containing protein [Tissierellia bacterium]
MKKNIEVYVLENKYLQVDILKDFGAKILSIVDKKDGEEFLFQSQSSYQVPKLGDDFSKYDTSGIDDCFPTIDSCEIKGINYPDHGSLWSIPWEMTGNHQKVFAKIRDPITKIEIEKIFSLKKQRLSIDYIFINKEEEPKEFLWVFHGLFQMKPEYTLLFPFDEKDLLQIHGKPGEFSIKNPKEYPINESFKWYLPHKIPLKGEIGYQGPEKRILFHYDRIKIPYLGLWVTTGGFKGERNWAIEPSTGYYDSLKKVLETDTQVHLSPQDSFTFTFEIEIKEDDNGRIKI